MRVLVTGGTGVVGTGRDVVHQRLVELQRVHGESREITQAGITRAEVVDGQADADARLAALSASDRYRTYLCTAAENSSQFRNGCPAQRRIQTAPSNPSIALFGVSDVDHQASYIFHRVASASRTCRSSAASAIRRLLTALPPDAIGV